MTEQKVNENETQSKNDIEYQETLKRIKEQGETRERVEKTFTFDKEIYGIFLEEVEHLKKISEKEKC